MRATEYKTVTARLIARLRRQAHMYAVHCNEAYLMGNHIAADRARRQQRLVTAQLRALELRESERQAAFDASLRTMYVHR